MVWVVVAVVVVGSLAALGAALLSTWRSVKELTAELGRSGDAVAESTVGLNTGLATIQERGVPSQTGGSTALPRSADGAGLAARVQAQRSGRR